MLLETIVDRSMRWEGTVFFGHFLAHRHGDIPRPVVVAAHAAQFLARQAVGPPVITSFSSGVIGSSRELTAAPSADAISACDAEICSIRRVGIFFRPRDVLIGIGRPMAVAGAA